ncbi:MarR family transcriptional regulator [Gilvimarinus sp. SDUM040013]|uniref:MarR family transcriptional regulator n=1 Tax=Gilvimarinus gilvus TaxID=3058038 RepID=A0ABU4RVI5_9GAMM|nr:MarR family transcriptional regulator [Gilvimarinus sp. SDUM040013]MDO3387678.1 MarR family transcriptional regulator [Gilvimarinus sp. SDUM040013]MDX6848881.1 MarR family transcriptional regulator [Gilvimarinus sp. SDUM040013]
MNEAEKIDHLLDRLSGLLRTEVRRLESAETLQPVQLEVLDYLKRANRFSDTAMSVTEYLGQTKGTVSQTIKVLQGRGLIHKTPDAEDRRVVHLVLTRKGEQVLNQLKPSPLLQQALGSLSPDCQQSLAAGLMELLSAMQRTNKAKAFGQCHSCQHNLNRNGGYWCGLTEEALSVDDVELICREFSAA